MSFIAAVFLGFLIMGAGLGAVAYLIYRQKLRKAKAIERGLKMVPVLIHLPPQSQDTQGGNRDVKEVMREKTAQAEVLYNLLAGTAVAGFRSAFYGQRHIALELIAAEGVVHFYAAVPVALVSTVEKALQTAYPGARMEMVEDHNIFNQEGRLAATLGGEMVLRSDSAYPIATYAKLDRDPMEALLTSISALEKHDGVAFQLMIRPATPNWIAKSLRLVDMKRRGRTGSGFTPQDMMKAAVKAPSQQRQEHREQLGSQSELTSLQQSEIESIEEKTKHPGFEVLIRVIVSTGSVARSQQLLRDIATTFALYDAPGLNGFTFLPAVDVQGLVTAFIFRFFPPELKGNVLNSVELATLFHLPDAQFVPSSSVERQKSKQIDGPVRLPSVGLLFGFNQFRGVRKEIRLSEEDRRRHTYILGQTGTGKSTMLENLAVQDMLAGNGFAFIDPHGDSAEKLLALVPKNRSEDVIYFNPGDTEYPLGLNLFEFTDPTQKDFLVQETINMLYKLYDPGHTGIIGPRYEHWYRNAALTLMSDPNGATFIEIPKVFTDTDYLKQKFKYLKDPTVIDFWTKEMGQTSDYHKSEMLGWFVSKFGAFQNNEMMRNIIGQTKSSFNLRDIMDNKKILIVNLSKGRVGELNSQLLGMIFVIKFQAAAMSRANVTEDQRPDFSLYVDEFQNFSTDSFSSILSEARKYRLNLIVANQFIGQLKPEIRDAVFGNIGTIVAHRMGPEDAEFMVKQFAPVFDASDLMNLPNYNAAMRLMIGGLPSRPFTIVDSPPLGKPNLALGLAVKQLSAAKYGHERAVVEADIMSRLSGQPGSGLPAPAPVSGGAALPGQAPAPVSAPDGAVAVPGGATSGALPVTQALATPAAMPVAPALAPMPAMPMAPSSAMTPPAAPVAPVTPALASMPAPDPMMNQLPSSMTMPNGPGAAPVMPVQPAPVSDPLSAIPGIPPAPAGSMVMPAGSTARDTGAMGGADFSATPYESQIGQRPLTALEIAQARVSSAGMAPTSNMNPMGSGSVVDPMASVLPAANELLPGEATVPPPIGAPPVDLGAAPLAQPMPLATAPATAVQNQGAVYNAPSQPLTNPMGPMSQPVAMAASGQFAPAGQAPTGYTAPAATAGGSAAAVADGAMAPVAPPPIGAPPVILTDPLGAPVPGSDGGVPLMEEPAPTPMAAPPMPSDHGTLSVMDITGGQPLPSASRSQAPMAADAVPLTEASVPQPVNAPPLLEEAPAPLAPAPSVEPQSMEPQSMDYAEPIQVGGDALPGDPYANIDLLEDYTPPTMAAPVIEATAAQPAEGPVSDEMPLLAEPALIDNGLPPILETPGQVAPQVYSRPAQPPAMAPSPAPVVAGGLPVQPVEPILEPAQPEPTRAVFTEPVRTRPTPVQSPEQPAPPVAAEPAALPEEPVSVAAEAEGPAAEAEGQNSAEPTSVAEGAVGGESFIHFVDPKAEEVLARPDIPQRVQPEVEPLQVERAPEPASGVLSTLASEASGASVVQRSAAMTPVPSELITAMSQGVTLTPHPSLLESEEPAAEAMSTSGVAATSQKQTPVEALPATSTQPDVAPAVQADMAKRSSEQLVQKQPGLSTEKIDVTEHEQNVSEAASDEQKPASVAVASAAEMVPVKPEIQQPEAKLAQVPSAESGKPAPASHESTAPVTAPAPLQPIVAAPVAVTPVAGIASAPVAPVLTTQATSPEEPETAAEVATQSARSTQPVPEALPVAASKPEPVAVSETKSAAVPEPAPVTPPAPALAVALPPATPVSAPAAASAPAPAAAPAPAPAPVTPSAAPTPSPAEPVAVEVASPAEPVVAASSAPASAASVSGSSGVSVPVSTSAASTPAPAVPEQPATQPTAKPVVAESTEAAQPSAAPQAPAAQKSPEPAPVTPVTQPVSAPKPELSQPSVTQSAPERSAPVISSAPIVASASGVESVAQMLDEAHVPMALSQADIKRGAVEAASRGTAQPSAGPLPAGSEVGTPASADSAVVAPAPVESRVPEAASVPAAAVAGQPEVKPGAAVAPSVTAEQAPEESAQAQIKQAQHEIDDLLSESLIKLDGRKRLPDADPELAETEEGQDLAVEPEKPRVEKVIHPSQKLRIEPPTTQRRLLDLVELDTSAPAPAAPPPGALVPVAPVSAATSSAVAPTAIKRQPTQVSSTSVSVPVPAPVPAQVSASAAPAQVVRPKVIVQAPVAPIAPVAQATEAPASAPVAPVARIIQPQHRPMESRPAAPVSQEPVIVKHGGNLLPEAVVDQPAVVTEDESLIPQAESLAANDVARARAEREAQVKLRVAAQAAAVAPVASNKISRHRQRRRDQEKHLPERVESQAEAEHNRPTEAETRVAPMAGKLIMPNAQKPHLKLEPTHLIRPKKLAPGEVFVDEHGNVIVGE